MKKRNFDLDRAVEKLQADYWRPEGYFSSKELASLFDVTPITINKWARQGKFKQYKISSAKILTPVSEVKRYIASLKLIKKDW